MHRLEKEVVAVHHLVQSDAATRRHFYSDVGHWHTPSTCWTECTTGDLAAQRVQHWHRKIILRWHWQWPPSRAVGLIAPMGNEAGSDSRCDQRADLGKNLWSQDRKAGGDVARASSYVRRICGILDAALC